MAVRSIFVALVTLLTWGSGLSADERPAQGRIVSLGLFKNGLATVRQEIRIEAAGTYRLDDSPEPVHGTYWVESEVPVETLVKCAKWKCPPARPAM